MYLEPLHFDKAIIRERNLSLRGYVHQCVHTSNLSTATFLPKIFSNKKCLNEDERKTTKRHQQNISFCLLLRR